MTSATIAGASIPGRTSATSRHIALFFPALSFGGIEKVMLELAAGFLERGIAVDIVPASAEGEFREHVPKGAALFDLGSPRVLFSLRALINYLRRERPDVLISAPEHANVVALWARKLARIETKVLITQHNVFSGNMKYAYGLRGRIAIWLAKRSYPTADGVIAVSDGVASDLTTSTGVEASKIRRVYNPVKLCPANPSEVPHSWFAPGEVPVIVAAGRLTPEKGFATLIAAFVKVLQNQAARLMILGEGPERASLEERAAQLGIRDSVLMTGYVRNPTAYFARAAVFVLPSERESFSLTLVEAMSTGVPIVATGCHGPREILENGRHGVLVPVGDADAMAAAILKQLANPQRKIPVETLRRFSRATAVDGYLEAIEALWDVGAVSRR